MPRALPRAGQLTLTFWITQLVGTVPTPADEDTVTPLRNQIATAPLVVSRHSRSPLPSPLKSATPATVQGEGTVPMPPLCTTWDPLSSQIAVLPAVSRQSRSPLPSALKSPVPAIVQVVDTVPRPALEETAVPLRDQMATAPLVVSALKLGAG